MISITSKTLQDLEFQIVLSQIEALATTDLGKKGVTQITPKKTALEIKESLFKTNEYLSSFDNENTIPSYYFEAITQELKQLTIEDYFLEVSSLNKIKLLSESTNTLLLFFKKYQEYYPKLNQTASKIEYSKVIPTAIGDVINKFNEVKDDASPALYNIRKQLKGIQGAIRKSFVGALSHFNSLGYLADTKESIIDDRPVLAVIAMHRKKVKGALLGHSKTGSISYIEPQATAQLNRDYQDLKCLEREEVVKILKTLTRFISEHIILLKTYQDFLTSIDVISAKAMYAKKMNAILPEISDKQALYIRDAYHPLLYLANSKKGEKTYPQTIELDHNNRIIVISGPNAGGKSITLKTIGLLQVMLQSGILIPVHGRSTMCLFDTILTDIGDNQSIENQLSTYSYRLKNMKHFLKKCTSKTLFLIDEFGTGSDPELGGALAESCLEVFYERKAFGVITTHYANLKLLADELPEVTNANMLFDTKSLAPTYQLALGQPGSSFTFEVAQKNGIPYSLINAAKKKVARGKIRFDKTIAKLQKERSKLEKTSKTLSTEEQKKRLETVKLESTNKRVQEKLEGFQQLYDSNQKMIALGERIEKMAVSYHNSKQKKVLIREFLKLIEIENSKRKKTTKKARVIQENKTKKIKAEATEKIAVIRTDKEVAKKRAAKVPKKIKHVLKVGDRVRLVDGKAVGDLEKIEKKKAFVNYGFFTSECSLEQLELVERKK